MTVAAPLRTPRPTIKQLGPQVCSLAADLPLLLTAPDVTAFRVEAFKLDQWLPWRKPDSTWVWQLTDTGHGTTRLVTRVHATYQWSRPLTALLGVALMEFGDFAMMRRMLRGIKERAETLAQSSVSEVPR